MHSGMPMGVGSVGHPMQAAMMRGAGAGQAASGAAPKGEHQLSAAQHAAMTTAAGITLPVGFQPNGGGRELAAA